MDFRTEFFPILNKILFKEKNNVSETLASNSDIFLMNRYISFYHPNFVEILNSTANKLLKDISFDNSGEYFIQILDCIMPKVPKKYIKYISKKRSSTVAKADLFVKEYAEKNNISEREVWGMLYLLEQIQK